MSSLTKTFCAAPFIHQTISTSGKKFLCCGVFHSTNRKITINRDLNDWEGKDYQYIRNHMLTSNDWLPDCEECKILENAGKPSLRINMNEMFIKLNQPSLSVSTGNPFGVPLSYDIRFSNLCNLSCRMCGPESSSQLVKEAKKHPELWPSWSNAEDEFKFNVNSNKDIDWLLEEAQFIRDLKLLGGEPTIQPEVHALLKRLVEVNNTNIDVFITTNGTNENKEFFNLLKQFKNVLMNFSIDSHPERLPYIRGGANGKKIWENIKKISEISWAGNMSINTTQVVMSYNIFDFWELGQLCKESSWIDTHRSWLLYTPEYQSARFIPRKWKETAIEIAKQNMCYDEEKYIFEELMLENENFDLLKKLKSTTELIDFSRNVYIKDYHPVCHEMLEDIG